VGLGTSGFWLPLCARCNMEGSPRAFGYLVMKNGTAIPISASASVSAKPIHM
jgi:hypothetical protein